MTIDYRSLLQQAWLEMRQMRTDLERLSQAQEQTSDLVEPIAIIGMDCRFPGGANSPEAYWELLRHGVDAITEVPRDRWDLATYYDPDPDLPGKLYSRHGGFLDQVDRFDPQFFGISPREALSLDPQQRLLLEVSYTALERAGQAPEQLQGSLTGVFVGISFDDYAKRSLHSGDLSRIDAFSSLGNTRSIAVGRIAYALGLQGPTMQLDTTCSSSLLAVHLACQSLRNHECHLALAGGVSLMLSPEPTIGFCKLKALSPTGRSKTFDAEADGYVRGEGCGIVVLKRLSDAIANQDPVLAVVRGSAVNHNGQSNGLTAPNGTAQTAVIRQAIAQAGISAQQVQYVEAHGTGTVLGDPIEVSALNQALAADRSIDQPLLIGSVKTNIGHLEAAAGIAGLIKVILSLQNQQIPPHLHLQKPNPHIAWEKLAIAVPTQLTPWAIDTERTNTEGKNTERTNTKRTAGVSSFGMSGTNVHLIVQEPRIEQTPLQQGDIATLNLATLEMPRLLTLSAQNPDALQMLIQNYQAFLQQSCDLAFPNLYFTANTGRSHFEHRLALLSDSLEQLQAQLTQLIHHQNPQDTSKVFSGCTAKTPIKVAFLFTGQGSQYLHMGAQLYRTQSVFRQAIDRCADLLQPYLDVPLLEILYPQSQSNTALLHQTRYTQPALFAIEYALCQLWQSWGIQPDVVVGHSIGEYVAACVADVLSLADALKLVAVRAQLMQSLPEIGMMAAVMAEESTVQQYLQLAAPDSVAIAAVNAPDNTVISGDRAAVRQLLETMAAQGIKSTPLQVSHAFHSPLMQPMLAEFRQIAAMIQYSQPKIRLVSNVTGRLATTAIADPDYWSRHIIQPVRFADSMQTLAQLNCTAFVEIGPKPTLLSLGRSCLPDSIALWLPSLRPPLPQSLQSQSLESQSLESQSATSDRHTLLASLAQLYVQGATVNWATFEQNDQPPSKRRILLPTYPFQRQRYWIDEPTLALNQQFSSQQFSLQQFSSQQCRSVHPLLGHPLHLAKVDSIYFESSLRQIPHYLRQHRLFDQPTMPLAGYIEMALAAASDRRSTPLELLNLVIHRPLYLKETPEATAIVQFILSPTAHGYDFEILGCLEQEDEQRSEWVLYVTGHLQVLTDRTAETSRTASDRMANLSRLQNNQQAQAIASHQFYQACRARGIDYGQDFQAIVQLWRNPDPVKQAWGKIALPHTSTGLSDFKISGTKQSSYCLHPVLLDAALQVVGVLLPENQTYLPIGFDRLIYHAAEIVPTWSEVTLRPTADQPNQGAILVADLQLYNDAGQSIATLIGLQLQPVSRAGTQSSDLQNWLYQIEWRSQPISTPAAISPATVRQQVMPQLSDLTAQPQLVAYAQFLPQLEMLSLNYITQALLELEWSFSPGQSYSIAEITQVLSILPQHQRLFERLLDILAEANILQRSGDRWEVLRSLPIVNLPDLELLQQQYPFAQAELSLLHHCGTQLAAVLQGRVNPLELLFPNGDLSIVSQLYQDSLGARLMNTAVQQVVQTIANQMPVDRPLRILELGAGTGGTTAYLLPILNATTTEYTFTDISPLFTAKAKEKFQNYPFVQYRILDIARSPAEQNYPVQFYDLLVAANVLHATPDLEQSLTHAQQLLTPGGMLILLEGVRPLRWLDLIFGLTTGWWCFTDQRSYPLLSAAQWQQHLQKAGFATTTIAPPLTDSAPQAVILGQKPEQPTSRSRWLIFADTHGTGAALSAQLQAQLQVQAHEVRLAFAAEQYRSIDEHCYQLDPANPADIQRFLQQNRGKGDRCHMIYLWSLDRVEPNALNAELVQTKTQTQCNRLLHLVQALTQYQSSPESAPLEHQLEHQLWIVTAAAVPTPYDTALPAIEQSPLWGLGKVIERELPELNCRCLDLDPSTPAIEQAQILVSELTAATPRSNVQYRWQMPQENIGLESQIAWRQQNRYVARLARTMVRTMIQTAIAENYHLAISQRGTLENLSWQPTGRRSPDVDEVEIRVHATGLNFRDVLNALDLYPGEAGLLGCECVGEVVAIGTAVQTVNLGDWVMAIASDSFSQYVTVNAAMVVQKPAQISPEEAATIPVAFLTAFYSLYHLAKLRPGDRVLIHAGAGGVGQAAIQLAQQAGATVFASAHPSKWKTLAALGVQHILNSRHLDFVEQIHQATDGEGIDVVLNSLSDDFVVASLSVLKPTGYLIDLGKGQPPSIPDRVTYTQVDLVELCQQQPDLIQSMLGAIADQFAAGILQPLPSTQFPMQQAISAFRMMQQAQHTGKILLIAPPQSRHHSPPIHPNATYLITGGLGGLGVLTAEWLAQQGAKHLVLVSRQPRSTVQFRLAALEQAGVSVEVAFVDVTQRSAMIALLDRIAETMPPLKGVFHAAGVLNDSLLQQMTTAQMVEVMQPKIMGAWHLHELTAANSLDFFVLFSSATALLGSPGQANHVAANTFLDTLAHYRQALGQPALSINWGIWSEVGSAVDRIAQMDLKGIGTIAPAQGMTVLAQLLQQAAVQVGVVPIQWRQFYQQGLTPPFFADFAIELESTPTPQSTSTATLLTEFQSASPNQRRSLIEQYLRTQLAQVLGFPPSAIDADKGFFDLGMDSLTAVELKNRLQTSLNCSLSATVIFDYPTLNALVDYLAQYLTQRFDRSPSQFNIPANSPEAETEQQIDRSTSELSLNELSEAELADLLEQELASLGQEVLS